MKKACLLALTFMFIAAISKAQDIITLTNGTQVQAKVLEINPGDVKYKDYNNPDGPVITISKSGVSEIQYANGIKTVLNNSNNSNTGSGGYKREVYTSSKGGYKKESQKNSRLHGWYFGAGVNFGISGATSTDPSYSTSGDSYTGLNFLATKMFNQHIGIQFGLGSESYSYDIGYGNNSASINPDDVFTLSCLTIPARALYISNSKRRAGLYVMAGFDLSILVVARDAEGDNLTRYYSTALFSPYIGSGVAFRTKNARALWLFGLYYKTTVSNFYSGSSDNAGILAPGNTGELNSVGLSVTYNGKFGRGR